MYRFYYCCEIRLICFLFPVRSSPSPRGLQCHLCHTLIPRYDWSRFRSLHCSLICLCKFYRFLFTVVLYLVYFSVLRVKTFFTIFFYAIFRRISFFQTWKVLQVVLLLLISNLHCSQQLRALCYRFFEI
ncbi:hypothetical protein HJG60_010478 [Phyllostomus discolor]|uniref:Uncharacterized protein n=1 Tax=Phyllostomus discolor TaxID=89673 RepID=A0A834EEW8_9CHIR|nr:hypothetical protein HJG60_010478 [Phyllostomus discolor]